MTHFPLLHFQRPTLIDVGPQIRYQTGRSWYQFIILYIGAKCCGCLIYDDEIAYFTVRCKTRASVVYRTKNMK